MTITCQEETFSIHKLVVCPRSAFFDRVCDSQFKGPICVDDKDPILVGKVLEFLYTGHVTEPYLLADGGIPGGDSVGGRNRRYQRARLYAEADYFAIDDLKRTIMEEFRSSFFPYEPNGPLSVSVRNQVDADTFAETIKEIYSERADYGELRKVVIENLKVHIDYLWSSGNPIISSKLESSAPGFTHDLLKAAFTKCVVDPKPIAGGQITPAKMISGPPGFVSQNQPSAFGFQVSAFRAQPSTYVTQPSAFMAQSSTFGAQSSTFMAQSSTLVTRPSTFGPPLMARPSSFGAQPTLHGNQSTVFGTMTVAQRW